MSDDREKEVARLALENDRLRKLVRSRVIRWSPDPDVTQFYCELCGKYWDEGRKENHEPECLAKERA